MKAITGPHKRRKIDAYMDMTKDGRADFGFTVKEDHVVLRAGMRMSPDRIIELVDALCVAYNKIAGENVMGYHVNPKKGVV